MKADGLDMRKYSWNGALHIVLSKIFHFTDYENKKFNQCLLVSPSMSHLLFQSKNIITFMNDLYCEHAKIIGTLKNLAKYFRLTTRNT